MVFGQPDDADPAPPKYTAVLGIEQQFVDPSRGFLSSRFHPPIVVNHHVLGQYTQRKANSSRSQGR
jgi:hypothetical protein